MRTNVANSIQEYCKKINSWLTVTDIISLTVTVLALAALTTYITYKEKENASKVVYIEGIRTEEQEKSTSKDSLPFGSKNGETYTFSWCSGSKNISAKNKIYFSNEQDAIVQGRRLSKLCKK